MSVTQVGPPDEPSVEIRETYMKPTADWPEGGYMCEVGGKVEIATGYYATIYPDKPSLYWHGKAPAVIRWELGDLPWNRPQAIVPFQCGSGEMGTFYWSKDADLDKLPSMNPVPIDPEIDRIDFYIKGPDGYIPWTPTEAQKQMLSIFGLPTRADDTVPASPPVSPK
ncbi:MAG: hypothetical protein WA213_20710 [Terriglobales bacterium]